MEQMKRPTPVLSLAALPKDQPFSALEPGSLLHDFHALLDEVQAGNVPLSEKNGLPAGATLTALNARMHRPVLLDLKRVGLISHPYLMGLYLLAQGANFLMVEGGRARLSPVTMESWAALNDTERYFNLLEVGFVHADPSQIGQGRRDSMRDALRNWERVGGVGMTFDPNERFDPYQFPFYDMYQLALFDLFGLLATRHASAPLRPWRPVEVRQTAWGQAVCPLLRQWLAGVYLSEKKKWGGFKRLFGPAYPEYRRVLVNELPVQRREGVYVFKVSLGKVWRRLALPHDLTLDGLVGVVLKAYRFDNDHLYQFTFRDRGGRRVQVAHPYTGEEPCTDQVELAELPIDPGMSMELLYDFGDSWLFTVKLEKVELPGVIKKKLPCLLEQEGKAPEQYPDSD